YRRGPDFFQAEDGIRDRNVTGVQTCALPIFGGIGMDQDINANYWVQLGVMLALGIIFHIVLRLRAPFADQYILPLALALNGLGLAMIHRLDLVPPGESLANNQLMWT